MTEIAYYATGKVELLDYLGDDLAIVNAALVSFAETSRLALRCASCGEVDPCHGSSTGHATTIGLSGADVGLIRYLMRHRRGTPFEMVTFKFHVACPIRVAREWQRHRIGSFNEVSTRYVEPAPACFLPASDAVRVHAGQPGAYTFEQASATTIVATRTAMRLAYETAWTQYQALLSIGVAKEVAAFVLPLGLRTEFIWSVNLRSLLNFVSLRNDARALQEIRELANEVEHQAAKVVPHAMAAFNREGRIAP